MHLLITSTKGGGKLTESKLDFSVVNLLPITEILVGHISKDNEDGEEDEGENGFPQFHVIRRNGNQNDDEPQVGKDAEGGCHDEHFDVFDASDIRGGDGHHADRSDDQ